MSRFNPKYAFFFVLAVCFFQFPRGYDVQGYLRGAADAFVSGYGAIPYATQQVGQGAYFQSPIVTVLCLPFARLPLLYGKLAWALMNVALLLCLLRVTVREKLSGGAALFLLLVFTYPLSDVFLSGNINFLLLALCVLGWTLLESDVQLSWAAGGTMLALAVFVKPLALVFLPWYAFRAPRKLFPILVGFLFCFALTAIVMGPTHFAPWWKGWLGAMKFYPWAAGPGRLSFQSPPAALYRILDARTALSFDAKLFTSNAFGALLMGAFLLHALFVREREALALLLASIFFGTPFSWACTILFLFPLLEAYASCNDISGTDWTLAVLFAVSQKAILPPALWDVLIHGSFHALLLAALSVIAIWRESSKATAAARSSSWRRRPFPS